MIYGLMVASGTACLIVGALVAFGLKVRNTWLIGAAILITGIATPVIISKFVLDAALSFGQAALIGLLIGGVIAAGFIVPHLMRLAFLFHEGLLIQTNRTAKRQQDSTADIL